MKPTALALAVAVVWGLLALLVGVLNLVWPAYGTAFLDLMASVYHGYDAGRTVTQVLILTGYALVDGAILGYLVGWLYARFAGRTS